MIQIWCDGSCLRANKGETGKEGGVGIYILEANKKEHFIEIALSNTKIGRCELIGILKSLLSITDKKNQKFIIYCDSLYAVNTCNLWLNHWVLLNELQYKKNTDILKVLYIELNKFKKENFQIKHVKGHQSNMGNHIADLLAAQARKKQELAIYDDRQIQNCINKL